MLGWFHGVDHASVRPLLQRSADIYRRIGDKQGLALSLRFLAACFLDDPATARPLTEESVALCREVMASHEEETDAVWNLADALFSNGRSALTQRDYPAAVSCCTESVRLFNKTGDQWRAAAPTLILGRVAFARGEYATARGHFQESLASLREAGDRFYAALLLDALALVALAEDDYEEATRFSQESLLIWREIGNTWRQADALRVLGISLYHQADYALALVSLKESIRAFKEAENSYGVELALGIVYLAGALEAHGHFLKAALLAGAGVGFLEPTNKGRVPTIRKGIDGIVSAIRAKLDEETFARAWAQGQAMTVEQVIEYTLRKV
jgi:tetratricopeptide (TPR) repeat protein